MVASDHFKELSDKTELTIVDRIVGEVFARRTVQEQIAKGFSPEAAGMSPAAFENLSESMKQEVINDWVLGIEVQADFGNNPLFKRREELSKEAAPSHWSIEWLQFHEKSESPNANNEEHSQCTPTLHGIKVTLHSDDFGDIQSSVVMPNCQSAGYIGLSTMEEAAKIIALGKLIALRGPHH